MEELIAWEQKVEVCRSLSLVQQYLEDGHLRTVVVLNISNLFFQRKDYASSHETAQEAAHLITASALSLEKVEPRMLAMLPKAYYMMGLSRMLAGEGREDESKGAKRGKGRLERALEAFAEGLRVLGKFFPQDVEQAEAYRRMMRKVEGMLEKREARGRPKVMVRGPESKSEHESTGSRVSSQKNYRIKLQQIENSDKGERKGRVDKMYSRAGSHPLENNDKIKGGEEGSTSRLKKASNCQARRVSQGPGVGSRLPANARIYSKREKLTDGDSLSINTNHLNPRAEMLAGEPRCQSALSEMDKLKSPTISQGFIGADSTKDQMSKKEDRKPKAGASKNKLQFGGQESKGKDIRKYQKNLYRIQKPFDGTQNDRVIYSQLMQKIDDLQKVKESLGKNIKPFRQDHLMDHLKDAFSRASEQNHHQMFLNLLRNVSTQQGHMNTTATYPKSQNVSKNSGEETSRSKLSAEPYTKVHQSSKQIDNPVARRPIMLPTGIITESTKGLSPQNNVDDSYQKDHSGILDRIAYKQSRFNNESGFKDGDKTENNYQSFNDSQNTSSESEVVKANSLNEISEIHSKPGRDMHQMTLRNYRVPQADRMRPCKK
jgi:hypothetical protein